MFVLQCIVFASIFFYFFNVSTPSHTSPVFYGYNESGSLIYFLVDFYVLLQKFIVESKHTHLKKLNNNRKLSSSSRQVFSFGFLFFLHILFVASVSSDTYFSIFLVDQKMKNRRKTFLYISTSFICINFTFFCTE